MPHPDKVVDKTVTITTRDEKGNPQNILVNQLPQQIQDEIDVFDILTQDCSDKYYAKLQADLAAQAQQSKIIAMVQRYYAEVQRQNAEEKVEETTKSDA